MTHDHACDDYGLTRRHFLRNSAALGAAGVATQMFGDVLTATAFGASSASNVLVVVSLRGGADGLSMVVPHAEAAYHAARRNTALQRSQLLVADDTFGLHPAFSPLVKDWTAGRVAALHAIGMPAPNRSHFDAMEALEDADAGSAARIGWLNRLISGLSSAPDVFDGMQIGSPILPTLMTGPAPVVATKQFGDLAGLFTDSATTRARVHSALKKEYSAYGQAVGKAGLEALVLADRANKINKVVEAGPAAGVTYPQYSELGAALQASAGLIKSGVGVRAIAVDAGGWDHHVDLKSRVDRSVKELATCLAMFMKDLGTHAGRVTIVTISEFGRRLQENGSYGVDHGYGNAMMVMGAGVKGGKYYGRWPGLSAGSQVDGDLAVTTDYRSVLSEILRARFSSVDVSKVFPGAKDSPLGFIA